MRNRMLEELRREVPPLAKFVVAVLILAVILSAAGVVGGRESSSSGEPAIATPTSTTAPARTPRPPAVGGGSVEATPFEEVEVHLGVRPTPRAEASTVATQALTATVTVVTTVDAAPATPMVTIAPRSEVGGNEAQALAAIEAHFPASEQATAYRVASCETGGTFDPTKVGKAGEQGIFQVMAVYHGPVPGDIDGQARQAAGIVAAHGWLPWSCY
ncbi:MAG: hypothetical protein AB7I38_11070 [Dehalococcoidia bacterium]